ncbi:hypothetical protein LCGC14_2472690 [marine sediment metagenome]|uniref:Uncharacterized protein n=1 Tax=marine sediment metagenome TaxID=412755 RepID=A0A0F9BXT5_9ZZZZ
MIRDTLIWFKEYLNVWFWMPIKRVAKATWRATFGPCCDNPNLEFSEIPGASMHKCLNCGSTRIHQSSRGF